jgi:hypothetical protein
MLTTTPDIEDLKTITSYGSLEQLIILKDICHRIYIARNISMNQESILESMNKIDKLFVDKSNYN